ncbi:MAG: restriction endonuclease subunit S [Smithellaceae bacterium]
MKGWNNSELSELILFQRGFDITKAQQTEGDVPIISSSGISSFHNKAKCKAPGVITGRKGTLGKVFYSNVAYWPHDTTLWVKNFKENNPKYAYYYLQLLKLETYDVGASNPTLNRNHIHKLKINIPDPAVQRKIAAVLSAYDDLIENNNRRIAILEKMAEELYREWFVRLCFPGHEQVKIVKGVPESWDVKRIGNIVDFLSGYSFKSETYLPSGKYGIVTIKNVQDGFFVPECSDFIDITPLNMKDHCILKTGDVLMSLTGNVGRICHVIGENYLLNQRVAKLRPKIKHATHFIYYTFKNRSMIQLIENLSLGSTAQMNLSPIQLGKQKLIVPEESLLLKYETATLPLYKEILSLLKTNATLKQTRDRFLSRLMSGKIDVANLDIQFPDSMKEEAAANA